MKELFEYIDNNLDRYLSILKDFVEIPSVTHDKANISRCAEFLSCVLKSCGINSSIIQTDGNPVVYGEICTNENYQTLLIYGHYDVQPAGVLGGWDNDPFKLTIKGGKMFARGVSDDKGQILANIMGVEAFLKLKGTLPVNIKFMFEGEEETGSQNLETFLKNNKRMLQSNLMFGSDTHIHMDGLPIVYLGNKGLLQIELTVTTSKTEVHSQNGPVVPNAAWILVDILKLICDRNGNIGINGFYDNITPPQQEEFDAVNKIPFNNDEKTKNAGYSLLLNKRSKGYYSDLIFTPTCSITGLRSGFIEEGMKSIIPHQASAKLNFYLVPEQDPYDIVNKIEADLLAENLLNGVDIKVFTSTKASRLSIKNRYVPMFKKSISEVWGCDPLIIPNCPGTNPGFLFEKHLGLNFILVPFGHADENAHADNENMPIEALLKGIKTTTSIVNNLGNMFL